MPALLMTPNEKNLEKLVKKIVKQQPVNVADLFFHWGGLSGRGDRIVINTLNRHNGWEAFLMWSESEAEARTKLQRIADLAGISEAGVLALKSARLASAGEETERSQSLRVLQTVRGGKKENWGEAAQRILKEEDFFEGTLSLLETEETIPTAEFLTFLLQSHLTHEQDKAIRKTLYRFRQKGIVMPAEQKGIEFTSETERTEIFLLAENRLPLWQPFFYYSGKGARGDWFFAEINEGKSFEIVQQQRNVRMNQKDMTRIAKNYAAHFEQGTGVKMAFLSMPPAHARYFVETSFDFLSGAEEFRRYIGVTEKENPFVEMDISGNVLQADAISLLNQEFFILWMVEEDFLARLFDRIKQIEEGPIILPEQQRRHQKSEVMEQAIEEYFSPEKRKIWALALEKAAYSLKNSDSDSTKSALGFAKMLSDAEKNISLIPFATVLFERSMEIHEKQLSKQKSEEKKTSLIMSPQEFERSMKKS
jgi:hypothetical protein